MVEIIYFDKEQTKTYSKFSFNDVFLKLAPKNLPVTSFPSDVLGTWVSTIETESLRSVELKHEIKNGLIF